MYRHLGAAGKPYIATVLDGQEPLGSLPLAIEGATARFLGSHEVCDYQDMISAPGKHIQVLETILVHLADSGVRQLDLRSLRPDALVLSAFGSLWSTPLQDVLMLDETTHETALPGTWEEFLSQLGGKQRHEVRRKLRRLENHGRTGYRCVRSGEMVDAAGETFLMLFRRNRPDKAHFMTNAMAGYFRDLIKQLASRSMLRLFVLEVDDQPAASVLCFDYRQTRYLYNSGYDDAFESLSVGALSKIMSIRDAIETGCGRYDFLKGTEAYKKRLGGKQTPLYRCTIAI